MIDGTSVYKGYNAAGPQAAKFAGPYAGTPAGAMMRATPGTPAAAKATQANSNLPSPVTWLVAAIILLILLKLLSENPKTALEVKHLHIGGYNTLAILVIAIIGIPALKILVDRPAFQSKPLNGFAALINAT